MIVHNLEHEKEYTLLLNTGERIKAIFYKLRRELVLPAMSVSFRPTEGFPTHVTINERLNTDTFFHLNKPLDATNISKVYVNGEPILFNHLLKSI